MIKTVEATNTTIARGRRAVLNRSHRKEKLESQGSEPKPRRKETAGEIKALLRSYEQRLEEVNQLQLWRRGLRLAEKGNWP